MSALPLAEVSGEAAKAGPIAVLVIILLCIACYFLFRSMSRHLRTVREQFPTGSGPESRPAPDQDDEPPA